MTLLQKLTELMEKNSDTVASLSRKTNLPYTTIDGLFKKGYAGARIPTIEAIARAYGVSLDYLVRDEITDPLYGILMQIESPEETRLLHAWRGAEEAARRMAIDMLETHPAKAQPEETKKEREA